MLRTLDLRGRRGDGRALLPRAELDVEAATAAVAPIIAAVAERGVDALREFSQRFDRCVPADFRVPAEALAAALAGIGPELRHAFEESIRRRRAVALAELGEERVVVEVAPGARVSQRMIPVRRVGLYVPGGLAPLAS